MNMACVLLGLTPESACRRHRAGGAGAGEGGIGWHVGAGEQADLILWDIETPTKARLCHRLQPPGPVIRRGALRDGGQIA